MDLPCLYPYYIVFSFENSRIDWPERILPFYPMARADAIPAQSPDRDELDRFRTQLLRPDNYAT
jgi:hypothetical protein